MGVRVDGWGHDSATHPVVTAAGGTSRSSVSKGGGGCGDGDGGEPALGSGKYAFSSRLSLVPYFRYERHISLVVTW